MLVFNQRSHELINNILVNAMSHQMYAGYKVSKDERTYSYAGAIAIKVISPSGLGNMFLFYPTCDGRGNIGSCAIYGAQLSGHKHAIESSMSLFGLPVESVEWDNGVERFLDVTIANY